MILDLRDIKRKGKDYIDFFFEYVPEKDFSDASFLEVATPVLVEGRATLSGEHSAFIECEVTFRIKGSCTRCLAETEREYEAEIREHCEEDTEDGYPVIHDRIDLSKMVDDVILMNLPVSFLCKDDCLGLCPNCGENLNHGECKCKNS
jgi:uncharacterized protein